MFRTFIRNNITLVSVILFSIIFILVQDNEAWISIQTGMVVSASLVSGMKNKTMNASMSYFH